MGTVIYYLALPFIYMISALPFGILYGLSNIVYVFVYKIFGYRKSVVLQNLRNSFPEKSDAEILKIASKFYMFFCDFMLETLKMLTISPRAIRRHMTFEGLSVFEPFAERQQSVIIAMGHYGNWELAGARFGQEPIHRFCAIYKPLKNKLFDQLLLHSRTRHGSWMYKMRQAFREMVTNKKILTATVFLADQTPPPIGKLYWSTFMHQESPMFTGLDQVSRRYNYPVIYLCPRRIKRGKYVLEAEVLAERPSELPEFEVIKRYIKRLEQDIRKQPELWLWTHRRWKHKRGTLTV